MRTFLEVFPDATLWLNGELMVGSLEPLSVRRDTIDRALAVPSSGGFLRGIGLDSFDTLKEWYTAGPHEMRAFVGNGPTLTDDRPLLEYYRSLPPDHEELDLSTLRGRVSEVVAN